jgi:error-prone DNA polymerase
VFESVQPKVARTVFHSYAMAVWGELRRTGVGGVSIIAEDIWDLTALHRARSRGELRETMAASGGPTASAARVEPRSPARKLWHASGGSAG